MEFERHPEYKYVLGEIWDAGSEYWLQISDVYKYGWDWNLNMMEDEGPIELMLRISLNYSCNHRSYPFCA